MNSIIFLVIVPLLLYSPTILAYSLLRVYLISCMYQYIIKLICRLPNSIGMPIAIPKTNTLYFSRYYILSIL